MSGAVLIAGALVCLGAMLGLAHSVASPRRRPDGTLIATLLLGAVTLILIVIIIVLPERWH